jgi:hypothetical protein
MKNYRLSFDQTKRDVIEGILNHTIDIKTIKYLSLSGGYIGSIMPRPTTNMRAIIYVYDAVKSNSINGKCNNIYEPFASSFTLEKGLLEIKNGKLQVTEYWSARY